MKDLEVCKIKKTPSIAMIMMVIMSFSNLFGLNIAGLSVVIGVVIFFINGALEKRPTSDNGLDIKGGIGDNLKIKDLVLDIATFSYGYNMSYNFKTILTGIHRV